MKGSAIMMRFILFCCWLAFWAVAGMTVAASLKYLF